MVARLTIASKNSSIHTSVTDVDLPSELIMDIAPDLSGGGSKGNAVTYSQVTRYS